MKILQQTEVKLEFSDIERRVIPVMGETERSSGYHVSGILRAVAVNSGILILGNSGSGNVDSTKSPASSANSAVMDVDEEIMPLRMALGMAWEEWAVGLYPEIIWQPGERREAGISGSVDGITIGAGWNDIVEEFKCTWKTLRRGIGEHWLWMKQGQAYCHLWETDLCRYHVCYVNGDYRQRREPVYMRYLVQFTEREIQAAWRLIYNNRHLAQPE